MSVNLSVSVSPDSICDPELGNRGARSPFAQTTDNRWSFTRIAPGSPRFFVRQLQASRKD